MSRSRLIRSAALLLVCLLPGIAQAQSLRLQVESRDLYAQLPFTLSLLAQGFDEEPQPEPPELRIAGCEVTYLGVSPSVSSRIQIINGRRSEWRDVTFVYRWRVEAPAAGAYEVPALTVTQDGKRASTPAAGFTVKAIEATADMVVRMNLPERPVWVGETFDVSVEWLLRRDVGEYEFVVPLFDLDSVRVEPPADSDGRTLSFPAGAREIALPIVQDQITEAGTRYTRFRFPARVTVTRPGPLDLEPVIVAASLESGTRRDSFGFRVPSYKLYKAEGERGRLVVRPLPVTGRPPSFENAIGSAFAIDVQASRTVVQVGDPIELQIRIRGGGGLEGLSLPSLVGEESLPPELFSVPNTATVGVIDEAENAKTFKVTVRIRSAEAREIPPIAFSYFDPMRGEYATAYSQPIALSVAGSTLVDAGDVSAAPAATAAAGASAPAGMDTPGASGNALASLIGADMSLSAPAETLRPVWRARDILPALLLLYSLPLLVVGVRLWSVRTEGRRKHERAIRRAVHELEQALASGAAAQETAPRIVNAMRALARLSGQHRAVRSPVLERLETRAFDPSAAARPLEAELAQEIRGLAREWAGAARSRATRPAAVATSLLLGLALASMAWTAAGAAEGDEGLAQARELYQAALAEPDRVRRTRMFADAEQIFRALAHEQPDAPDVLTDWGNAALGARDIGRSVLAYRRALLIDPSHERAQKNLDWLRERAPVWLPRPGSRGALDSLFFWHYSLSRAQRHLIGASAFALAVLLLAPWPLRRRALLRRLAVPALIVWMAATGSALLAGDGAEDAVVLRDGTVLRAADSLGAPPAFANPLPAGAELSVLERRERWTRVALADGTRGWVAASAVETVRR